jgi:dTDP-glucose 4,6-dehydratase
MAYYRTFNTPITISRCSNNYGPYQYPEKLIPLMIQKARENEMLAVYGTGNNIRDWLFVSDHCNAIDTIIAKGTAGNIYNIGSHNERSNLQIVHSILDQMSKPYSLIRYVADRPGHDLRYGIDPSKIRSLGWIDLVPFDTGIKETIDWNINNEKWIKSVVGKNANSFFKTYYKNR